MEKQNKEVWKYVPEYEGIYEVSSYGRVRSKTRTDKKGNKHKGKIIKPYEDINGYMKVKLSNGGDRRTFMVHRLVAQAFLLLPTKKYEVHHKDHNKQNNNVENLQWITRSENMLLAYEAGVIKKKLSNEDVNFIRKHFKFKDKKYGVKALAEKFNVSLNHIRDIIKNKSQIDVNYKYKER